MFAFRFQKVLDIRSNIEKEKMASYALALQQKEEAEKTVRYWENELEERLAILRTLCNKQPMPMAEVGHYRMQCDVIRNKQHQAKFMLEEASIQLQKAEEKLMQATTERKSVEKLRERDKAAHLQMKARQEQNTMDEVSARREHMIRLSQIQTV